MDEMIAWADGKVWLRIPLVLVLLDVYLINAPLYRSVAQFSLWK